MLNTLTEIKLKVGGVPGSGYQAAVELLKTVCFVVQIFYDPEWSFPVGSELVSPGYFVCFSSDPSYQIFRVKGSWSDFGVVFLHGS